MCIRDRYSIKNGLNPFYSEDEKLLVEERNGYHLPTKKEWEVASSCISQNIKKIYRPEQLHLISDYNEMDLFEWCEVQIIEREDESKIKSGVLKKGFYLNDGNAKKKTLQKEDKKEDKKDKQTRTTRSLRSYGRSKSNNLDY